MADLLKREVDTAIEHRAGNRHQDAEFLLSHGDAKSLGNRGNEPNHLWSFPLEQSAVNHDPCGSGDKPRCFADRTNNCCLNGEVSFIRCGSLRCHRRENVWQVLGRFG